jgi:hypothetical protein
MKNLKLALGMLAIGALMTSCADKNTEMAQESVNSYEKYVDSVQNLSAEEAAANWAAVQDNYERMKMNAEGSLETLEEKEELQSKVDATTVKYEEYKVKVVAEKEKSDMVNAKVTMRKTLLGEAYPGDEDMTFMWVNKDNIADVYGNLVATVDANKDNYTREDWDEIKLLYEALDTRKNTVEKEGLSSEDNRRIAGLKVKFAPMYTVNRMGAKGEENAAAKE